jgi:hypothetical protein
MREFSIYSVIIISISITVIYIKQLVQKKIRPALAMWIFFSIAIGISMVTYLKDGDFTLYDNIMNATDLVYVVTVTIAILIFGDKSSKFTTFDKGCLVLVFIIVLFWLLTNNNQITNILMQLILVIAYFPVMKRLLTLKENTESFTVWIGMLIGPAISLLSSKGMLATIYSGRAILCVSLLLLLMLRVEIMDRRRKQKNSQVLNDSHSSD